MLLIMVKQTTLSSICCTELTAIFHRLAFFLANSSEAIVLIDDLL